MHLAFDDWDQVRTAYQVARLGTVSAAAEVMGVHHATIIRHIDALELQLGTKLFQRHARGYTATEAGNDLLRVADATQDQLSQLAGRLKGQGEAIKGDLIVTSLEFMSPYISPILARFQQKHPDVEIRFLTDERLFRMEYGEAHLAIRVGQKPSDPDYVVQPLRQFSMGLFGAKSYIEKFGQPKGFADLKDHRFVGFEGGGSRAPTQKWLIENALAENVTYKVTSTMSAFDAIQAGVGLGFVSHDIGERDSNLVQCLEPKAEWEVASWLVTHVDLHRTPKVQRILRMMKENLT
ncbi:MAG: LysR family transcriptional regulator [Paracoccaceae bacterium]|nr:LysR family transcriptional regulator [Paracoccaceae bacterium]